MNSQKVASVHSQESKPQKYSKKVQLFSLLVALYVILAFLNERFGHHIGLGGNPWWFSHWTEYVVIIFFGVWRTYSEKVPYTKKRLATLTLLIGVGWWIIPAYLKIPEPHLGTLPHTPIFPHLHVPGTITFFITLVLVYLFGRRIVCGWGCPCVAFRETVLFPFRKDTIRSKATNYLKYIRWPLFFLYMIIFIMILFSASYTSIFYRVFAALVAFPYFLSFLLSPLIGNRSYCRFVCPYGATFGLISRIGPFGVTLEKDTCTGCRLCEKVCDMGVPVYTEGIKNGEIESVEDCMGCARCITSCPKQSLGFRTFFTKEKSSSDKKQKV